ncbi:MAG: DUF3012 domain-containing protein [Alphaproteobacteria bacterium]|nr:DUF3012 domain-containing protein [Alphaproteobacteria bacterium]
MKTTICCLAATFMLLGCGPKEGSKEWCESMEKKPQAEWNAHDAEVFMKSGCITNPLAPEAPKAAPEAPKK